MRLDPRHHAGHVGRNAAPAPGRAPPPCRPVPGLSHARDRRPFRIRDRGRPGPARPAERPAHRRHRSPHRPGHDLTRLASSRMREYLEFEKPIAEIEEKIEKLAAAGQSRPGVQDDLRKLRAKLYQLQAEIYARLTPWQRTQVARHPQRPSTLDYIGRICDSYLELHGDRLYGDDQAIVAGAARPKRRPRLRVAQQNGQTAE